jgi:hypothetical protein
MGARRGGATESADDVAAPRHISPSLRRDMRLIASHARKTSSSRSTLKHVKTLRRGRPSGPCPESRDAVGQNSQHQDTRTKCVGSKASARFVPVASAELPEAPIKAYLHRTGLQEAPFQFLVPCGRPAKLFTQTPVVSVELFTLPT